ncbi:TPM domain-containing protein [Anaerococcus sp. Marseille-Q7828]|uniref:TPM domain-containing protein n=1 Tax=Anaerococcus sp. Marseille-Q7828 TaxID=3036300 RepID=UPI0024AE01F2|nr:TPM domain-containing protein [Anaerococcus sp. Marseille-Q7828]
MKKGKFVGINLLISLLILLFPLKSMASLPAIPSDFYYDELGMLDYNTKENITKTNKELVSKTGSQVMVATVKNTNGLPARDLGPQIFNKWKIGDKDKKNGVLILISEDDLSGKREVFITTGYGIEGRLNDGKVGRIIDNFMLEDLKDGNYSKAINEGFNAIVAEVADEYNVKLDGNYDYYLNENAGSGYEISFGTLFMMLVVFIVISNMLNRSRFYGRNRGRYYRGYPRYRRYHNDPFDSYTWTNSTNSFGGSFGGSSSNSSFSGGFTSGGGSSGGGGAGRSF